jgi:hypothetical protein
MLMWEDGIARTLDLREDDDSEERPHPPVPIRATPMAARYVGSKPGDR